jgi:acetyl esterase/lipase
MKTTITLTSKHFLKVTRFLIRFTSIKTRFKSAHHASLFVRVKGQKELSDHQNQNLIQISSSIKTSYLNEMAYYEINEASNHDSLILYLHGGAFVESALAQHLQFVNHLALNNDISVILPLYPRLPFSNAKHCLEELKALIEQMIQTHPSKSIVLMGDSAGGWLALSLAKIMYHELGIRTPQVVLLSPWCDLLMNDLDLKLEKKDPILSHEGLRYLGEQWNQTNHPIGFTMQDSLSFIENLSIFVGTYEIFLNQSRQLYTQAMSLGVKATLMEYEGMFHDFMLFPFHESNHVMQSIHDLIK